MSSQKIVLHLKSITKWLSLSRIVLSFVRYTVSVAINSDWGKSSLFPAKRSVGIYAVRHSSFSSFCCAVFPIPTETSLYFHSLVWEVQITPPSANTWEIPSVTLGLAKAVSIPSWETKLSAVALSRWWDEAYFPSKLEPGLNGQSRCPDPGPRGTQVSLLR